MDITIQLCLPSGRFQVVLFKIYSRDEWEIIITERCLSRSLNNKCLFKIQAMLKVRKTYNIFMNYILIITGMEFH